MSWDVHGVRVRAYDRQTEGLRQVGHANLCGSRSPERRVSMQAASAHQGGEQGSLP
jgi:hypothetical protein